VDGRDSFDPHMAESAGVNLKNLLWVRCRNMDQCLRATDLLLQGGGFGMVAVDVSDIPAETVRHVPLNVWFRFRRAVENTATILLLLEREANAKTCASLVLRLQADSARWHVTQRDGNPQRRHSIANVLDGFQVRAEVARLRVQAAAAVYSHDRFIVRDNFASRDDRGVSVETVFKTQTTWGYPSGGLPGEACLNKS
jgi:hypothetical protein